MELGQGPDSNPLDLSATNDDEMRSEEMRMVESLRAELRAELRKGTTCPVCDQHAQQYRRKLNAGMAHALVVMYRVCGLGFGYKPDVLSGVGAAARDESVLRFWDLMVERDKGGPDGHQGWWRVTEKGKAFVTGELKVQEYVTLYNGEFTGFEGDYVGIEKCLGSKFSLRELLDVT